MSPWKLLSRLAARLLRRHATACACPLCDPQEQEMRAVLSMPARHPELLTRELPADQEEALAALAARLWPDDEWAEIIIEIRRAEGQS
jgi:hypothetical protein